MKHYLNLFQTNKEKETLQSSQQPTDFRFSFQKPDHQQNDHMSPTSTCFSEGKSTFWQTQISDKLIQHEQQQQNIVVGQCQSLQGNLLGICLEKYATAVSDYLKGSLNYYSDKIFEFVLVREFQGLDLQKQQLPYILNKYYLLQKSTNNHDSIIFPQNSIIRCFLEEITYLNYEQINIELILIIGLIYSFKEKNMDQNKNSNEFLFKLAQNKNIHFINLQFLKENNFQSNRQQQLYMNFLEKIYQIISKLYMHYKIFQDDENEQKPQPEMIRNQLKLFSSQRDILDSDQEQQFMRLSCPNKKIKNQTNQ